MSQSDSGWKLAHHGMPFGCGWRRNCHTRTLQCRQMSAMAGRAAVSVGAGMGMMVEKLCGRVLNKDKAGENA